MDFDTAKENIQPLRGGRRADRLETVLGGEKELLDQERKEHEEAINTYSGQDPLDNWYNYICWIEQSYPKSGNESGLQEAVSKCIVKFENDKRYRQDRRLIKLFIKYIDTQDNPHELYEQLYNSGIGTMVADLYIAWSYYYDAANDFKKAEFIFQKGFNAGAQPYDELVQAHQAFSISVTQRMLYDDDQSKKQFQATMDEKRSALTSLRAYNKKFVGSIRLGQAIKSDNPGRYPANENIEGNRQQTKVNVRADEDAAGSSSQYPSSASTARSIFDISKKVENVHEAGPWNNASKTGKSHKLFDSKSIVSSQPGFSIMEDECLPPLPCRNKLYEKGSTLPSNWVSRNKPQTPWNIPTVIEEPTVPNSIPMYDKFMLYPSSDNEISPEELKGYRWFKKHEITAPIIDQLASVLENKYEYGSRIIPGFMNKNIKQASVSYKLEYELENPAFQFPIKRMISSDGKTEYCNEELLAEKFKRGEIRLVTNEDFEETITDDDNMDMTVIGDRRVSVYCLSRKSFVPRKSILRKSVMQPINEDENDKQEVVVKSNENRVRFEVPIAEEEEEEIEEKSNERRSILKRKLEIEEEEKAPNIKDRSASPESKRLSSEEDFFKPPLPPKTVSKSAFQVFDDEYNETISTQNFNFFVKSQSVSTPISKKSIPRLVPLSNTEIQQQELQKTEEIISPPAESTIQPNNLLKQLSTIVEVTETSNSTKSSVSQYSGDNDVDQQCKGYLKFTPCEVGRKWDDCSQNPLNMFRLPEEQTVTTPFIKTLMLPKLEDILNPRKPPALINDTIPVPLSVGDDLPLPNESLKIPAFSETIQNNENSVLYIPSMEVPATQEIKIPATQPTEHIEIPATQDISLTQFGKNTSLEILTFTDLTLRADNVEVQKHHSSNSKNLSEQNSVQEKTATNLDQNDKIVLNETIEIQKHQISGVKNLTIQSSKVLEMSARKQDESLKTSKVSELPKDLPEIGNLSINESDDHLEIPATQEVSPEHIENPATQEVSPEHIEIPETQEILAPIVASKKIPFSVYEDSVCEIPQVTAKEPITNNNQSNLSRKENLIVPELKRTNSNEFLELCADSPRIASMKAYPANATKNEISDLLKFSDAKSKVSLEATFSDMQINRPFKSPSPTMNILDADLNTMNFNLPLKFGKNSTIIVKDTMNVDPIVKIPQLDDSLNLSIEMNEEECRRLGTFILQKDDKIEKNDNVFKIPMMPSKKPTDQPQSSSTNNKNDGGFEIFQDDDEEDDDDDMSKSIYHKNNKKDLSLEIEDADTWEDEKMCSFVCDSKNRYEYTIIQQHDDSISFQLRETISKSKGNPFCKEIRNMILEQCNFELYLEEHVDSCVLLKNVPRLKIGDNLECGNNSYKIQKLIGKGGFGSVFEIRSLKNNVSYAAKQEKPANLWEYYILIELTSRLTSKRVSHMIPAYMHAKNAIIANNASILISEYSPFGTIIDVCNKFKVITGKNIDEYVGMIFASQILSILDYLHSCHIIHADIKPDNFLLMSKIEIGMKVPALQLIDFGSAIDMESFDKDDKFTYVVKTDNFTCCEMLENKPWTYQIDLFGLCGTVHVILFGKYMEVEKKLNNWQIKTRFPRYFQKELWDIFFNTLLNVFDCKNMPNLQSLKQQLDEEIAFRQKYILDKVTEFNNAMLS